MILKTITPQEARRLIADGAVLIDVREADERLRERISGAQHLPLSNLDESEFAVRQGGIVIFHCRSGARTQSQNARLAAKTGGVCDAYLLEGGLDAWRKAGLPTEIDRRQPIELQRQVQIGAGALGLIGTVLGLTASPWFFGIPLFVGAGLLFAGMTGYCGMALLLQRAPWNQAAQAAQ